MSDQRPNDPSPPEPQNRQGGRGQRERLDKNGSPRRAPRPASALLALIAMWILGVTITDHGLFTIGVIRDPLAASGFSALHQLTLSEVQHAAIVRATMEFAATELPIGVAQTVLGMLLLVASVRALLSRGTIGTFGIQVVIANLVLTVIEYFVSAPVRAQVIEAITTSNLPEFSDVNLAQHTWVLQAAWVLLEPVALVFCVFALGRWRRAEQQFAAAAGPKPDEEF